MDHEALNQAVQQKNYETFSDTYLVLGGGVNWIADSWVLGLKATGYMTKGSGYELNQPTFNNRTANMRYFYAVAKIGYQPFELPKEQLFYPSIGLGAGVGRLKLKPDATTESEKFNTAGALVDFSLNYEKVITLKETLRESWEFDEEESEVEEDEKLDPLSTKPFQFTLGISAGYLWSPEDGWQLDTLDSSPTRVSPQGFFVRLTIGMGRVR